MSVGVMKDYKLMLRHLHASICCCCLFHAAWTYFFSISRIIKLSKTIFLRLSTPPQNGFTRRVAPGACRIEGARRSRVAGIRR